MIEQNLLVRCVTEATAEVFQTMLGMDVLYDGLSAEARALETGLISLVGITGEWGGSGVFCCSPKLAGVICQRMLGNEPAAGAPAIDEEVLDVVAEVTNMMIGNIKNGLEIVTGPLAIGVPTVIHGRNFQFRNTTGLRGTALSFTTEGERFEVRISLALTGQDSAAVLRIPILGLANVGLAHV